MYKVQSHFFCLNILFENYRAHSYLEHGNYEQVFILELAHMSSYLFSYFLLNR